MITLVQTTITSTWDACMKLPRGDPEGAQDMTPQPLIWHIGHFEQKTLVKQQMQEEVVSEFTSFA